MHQKNILKKIFDQLRINQADSFALFRGEFNRQNCLWRAFAGVEKKFVVDTSNFSQLNDFLISNNKQFIYGYLTYDLKNKIEKLSTKFQPNIHFEIAEFIVPVDVITCLNDGSIEIISNQTGEKIIPELNLTNTVIKTVIPDNKLQSQVSKQEYLNDVQEIKQHIQLGDVYELNYCMEISGQEIQIDPTLVFTHLMEKTDAPFSAYLKTNNKYVLCASPERFLLRLGNKLVAQPMKGTTTRSRDETEDVKNKISLMHNEKERAENIMITDLVRNDLSKIAKPKSVKVEELCKVYSFKNVHQMISTVSCDIRDEVSFIEILRAAFPMGSMTGAPKIRAIQLIDEYEKSSRGIFSGSLGYFMPNGDFDFNVIIRSIMYDENKKCISTFAGSAITTNSIPELEYEECLLKMKAMIESLTN